MYLKSNEIVNFVPLAANPPLFQVVQFCPKILQAGGGYRHLPVLPSARGIKVHSLGKVIKFNQGNTGKFPKVIGKWLFTFR